MEDEEEMEREGGRKKMRNGESKGGEEERGKEKAGVTPWPHFSLLAAHAEEPVQPHAELGYSGTCSG